MRLAGIKGERKATWMKEHKSSLLAKLDDIMNLIQIYE